MLSCREAIAAMQGRPRTSSAVSSNSLLPVGGQVAIFMDHIVMIREVKHSSIIRVVRLFRDIIYRQDWNCKPTFSPRQKWRNVVDHFEVRVATTLNISLRRNCMSDEIKSRKIKFSLHEYQNNYLRKTSIGFLHTHNSYRHIGFYTFHTYQSFTLI